MDKKKIIIGTIFLMSMTSAGCTSNQVKYNYDEVVSISDVEDEEGIAYSRSVFINKKDEIDKYNKLKVIDYSAKLNEETLDYEINMVFKNISESKIDDIKMDIMANGLEYGFIVENISKNALDSNESFSANFKVSKEQLLKIYNPSVDINEDITIEEYRESIDKFLKAKTFSATYEYTYSSDLGEGLRLSHQLDFDGELLSEEMSIYNIIEDEAKVKNNHIENGEYLNLVNKEKYIDDRYNMMQLNDVSVSIDKKFNFEIKAKLKNISDEDVTNLEFTPSLMISSLGVQVPSNELIDVYKSPQIKPGEELEVKIKLNKKDMLKGVSEIDDEDLTKNFKTSVEKLKHLVDERKISIMCFYEYETKDDSRSNFVAYTDNGKLQSMYAYVNSK